MPNPLTYTATSPDMIRRSRVRQRVRLWNEARVILPIVLVSGLTFLFITHTDTQRAEALAKGKKTIDKRETIKRRETLRETRAAIKTRRV